jgi:hypothetical protein
MLHFFLFGIPEFLEFLGLSPNFCLYPLISEKKHLFPNSFYAILRMCMSLVFMLTSCRCESNCSKADFTTDITFHISLNFVGAKACTYLRKDRRDK